jgi:hypothetical protein
VQQRQRNPWKFLGLAIAVGIPTLLVAGAIVGMLEDDREMEKLASVVVADSAPPAFAVEACNRYAAAQADRGPADAKPGEAAAAAVTDVAANAPDSSERSAKDATGGLAGLSEENSRNAVTRAAFRECMVRKGYAS